MKTIEIIGRKADVTVRARPEGEGYGKALRICFRFHTLPHWRLNYAVLLQVAAAIEANLPHEHSDVVVVPLTDNECIDIEFTETPSEEKLSAVRTLVEATLENTRSDA